MNFNPRIILLSAIITLLISALPSFAAVKKSPVGAIVAWSGDVYVYHEDEAQGIKVKDMEGVYPRDTIVTSVKSKAKIVMKDDSILSLGESARIVVKDYLLAETTDKRVSIFKIFGGKMRTVVGRMLRGSGSRFQIETPTAVAGIKGTDFIVAASERDSEIVAISGEVEARNISPSIAGEVVLKPGLATKVQEGMAPAEPYEISARRLNELIEDTSIPVTVPIEMKEAGCIGCHEKIYSAMTGYTHQHPRASEECQMCHITDQLAAREISVNTFSKENILFLDVSEIVKYRVKVKIKDEEGKEAVSQGIEFTPSSVYEKMTDDKKPPVISNLKVEELKAGIFYSAVMTWETDEPSTSQVQYGLSTKYGDASLLDEKFTKEHAVIIDKLIPDEKYHVVAISKDPFENTTRSDDFTFKVKKPFLEKQEDSHVAPSVESIKVVKIGNKTALSWRVNKKASSAIYLSEIVSRKNIVSKEPHYPGLTTLKYAGLDGCSNQECHKGSSHKRISHPTGLLSWLKVAPSPDLPLGSGSVMLCATCHTSHGGEHEHILRKEESKLCTSCHTEKR